MMRVAPHEVRRVALIGTGLIGAGWAAYFVARGFDVVASDPAPGAEERLRRSVDGARAVLAEAGLAGASGSGELAFIASPEDAVAGADFVQENAPEDEALKVELYARLDAATPEGVLIASSTSALLPSRLQARCRHPERVLVGHPFNPPHLVPLVEVVGGARTAPEALDWAVAFYAGIGKRPIRVRREVVGHVANRLAAALWREAVHLVAEGVASVEDVDAAVSCGPGLRWAIMGPCLTYHLGGGEGGLVRFLEHFGPGQERRWETLGRPTLTPQLRARLIAGVEEEARGRPVTELARERDACLVSLLKALEGCRDKSTADRGMPAATPPAEG